MDEEEKAKAEQLRDLAVEKYRNGELSMVQAADLAGITMWEFIELLKQSSPKTASQTNPPIQGGEKSDASEEVQNTFGLEDI